MDEEKVLNPDEEIEVTDDLKSVIEERFEQLQLQSMLLGGQVVCQTILNKITAFEAEPGKRSMNDCKRLFKDIKQFCAQGVSRQVNADGSTTPQEEEVNNEEE